MMGLATSVVGAGFLLSFAFKKSPKDEYIKNKFDNALQISTQEITTTKKEDYTCKSNLLDFSISSETRNNNNKPHNNNPDHSPEAEACQEYRGMTIGFVRQFFTDDLEKIEINDINGFCDACQIFFKLLIFYNNKKNILYRNKNITVCKEEEETYDLFLKILSKFFHLLQNPCKKITNKNQEEFKNLARLFNNILGPWLSRIRINGKYEYLNSIVSLRFCNEKVLEELLSRENLLDLTNQIQ